jgi:hypothetical protein
MRETEGRAGKPRAALFVMAMSPRSTLPRHRQAKIECLDFGFATLQSVDKELTFADDIQRLE